MAVTINGVFTFVLQAYNVSFRFLLVVILVFANTLDLLEIKLESLVKNHLLFTPYIFRPCYGTRPDPTEEKPPTIVNRAEMTMLLISLAVLFNFRNIGALDTGN